jgi:hypothetical protein
VGDSVEICDKCGAVVEDGDIRYLIRIVSKVDDGGVIKSPIAEDEVAAIIKEMENANAADLERDVYEDRSYILCPPCKSEFMKNPMGGPTGESADDEAIP